MLDILSGRTHSTVGELQSVGISFWGAGGFVSGSLVSSATLTAPARAGGHSGQNPAPWPRGDNRALQQPTVLTASPQPCLVSLLCLSYSVLPTRGDCGRLQAARSPAVSGEGHQIPQYVN